MRRLLLFLLTVFSVSMIWADPVTVKSGSVAIFKKQAKALLEIDYASTMVKDQTLNDYLAGRGDDFVRDWPEDSKKAAEYFIVRFNKKNDEGMQLTSNASDASYKMIIHVNKLDMGNAASGFIPWASMRAGGVIVSGEVDLVSLKTNKVLCELVVDEVKGISNPSETIRLGMAYFELANRIFKLAKKCDDPIPSDDGGIEATSSDNSASVKEENLTKEKEIQVKEKSQSVKKVAPASKNLPSEAVLKAKSNLTLKRGAGGSFACLDGENRMSVYLDFSGATIDNKTEEDFIYYMTNTVREKERDANFAETWENEIKPQLTSTFISNANEELGDEDYLLRLTSQQGSAYTLKVVVNSIDDNGNNECDYLIVNTMTGEVMAHIKMEAKGGRVGRYIGLLDDGFSAAGEDFGSELVDELDDLK